MVVFRYLRHLTFGLKATPQTTMCQYKVHPNSKCRCQQFETERFKHLVKGVKCKTYSSS